MVAMSVLCKAGKPRLTSLSAKYDGERTKNCYNFTIGNPGMFEFFSPNYPNNYSNDTECERVIKGRPLSYDGVWQDLTRSSYDSTTWPSNQHRISGSVPLGGGVQLRVRLPRDKGRRVRLFQCDSKTVRTRVPQRYQFERSLPLLAVRLRWEHRVFRLPSGLFVQKAAK